MKQETSTQLQALNPGMPAAKADQKAESVGRGIALLAIGIFLMLIAAGLVLVPMVVFKEIPGIAFLIFTGIFGVIGALLLMAGGHVMSGEGLDAAAQAGSRVAKAIAATVGKIRGK